MLITALLRCYGGEFSCKNIKILVISDFKKFSIVFFSFFKPYEFNNGICFILYFSNAKETILRYSFSASPDSHEILPINSDTSTTRA